MADSPPRLAVVIGVDHYAGGIPELHNAVHDARAVMAVLRHHGFSLEEGTLISLLNGETTHAALVDLFAGRLRERVGPDHRVIVYFAGHGHAVSDEAGVLRGYLLPIDAQRRDRMRFLEMEFVRRALVELPCRHLLVILDCCSAGVFARARYRDIELEDGERPPLIRAAYEAMQQRRSFQVLASASHDERAVDSFEAKVAQDALGDHSPFARALLEALAPPASPADHDRDGVIQRTCGSRALEPFETPSSPIGVTSNHGASTCRTCAPRAMPVADGLLLGVRSYLRGPERDVGDRRMARFAMLRATSRRCHGSRSVRE